MSKDEKVLIEQEITDKGLISQAWQAYLDSFADTDDYCAQDQICYDQESFIAAMHDPEYFKYILFAGDKIIGLCFMTNNLVKARIAYCNDRYLKKKFPKYTSEGRLYYVTVLCITPNAQDQGYGFKLMAAMIAFFIKNHAAVAFDYSEQKNEGLADMVAMVAKNVHQSPAKVNLLDRQCYVTVHIVADGNPV